MSPTMFKGARSALLALSLLAPAAVQAYITSATLEYSADDGVQFYLNGKLLLSREDIRSKYHAFDYEELSTSDGTLPLNLFNMNGENLLAAENFDLGAGSVLMSYRLTVHHSSGDPVVIWSEPGTAKFLFVPRVGKAPEHWVEPGFDDSAWGMAREARVANTDGFLSPELYDPFFGGILGSGAFVPFVSYRSDAMAPEAGVRNLYRSRFSFPNKAAKPQVFVNPKTGLRGQKVALRLLPGADSADLGAFSVMAPLGPGLRFLQGSPGAAWDAKHQQVIWSYPDPAANAGIITMHLATVDKASGWERPDKALGPLKVEKQGLQGNIPDLLRNDAARFYPGDAGWFKVSPPAMPAGAETSLIRGVLFRFQLSSAATSGPTSRKTDQFVFNYSFDGSQRGALKEDAPIDVCTREGWHPGYYDATEDRAWTWDQIKALKVKIDAQARLEPDKNAVASCEIFVRYYMAAKTAPTLYVQVEEPACKDVPLSALVWNKPSGYVRSDPMGFKANPGACPTAVPVAMPIAVPRPVPGAPPVIATPAPAKDFGWVPMSLGCVRSAPEPFKRGGVFLYYCIKAPAKLTLEVSTIGGKVVRSMPAGDVAAGDGQIFFNGLDDQGHLLPPAKYNYKLNAESKGHLEAQPGLFTRVNDAR